MEGRKKERKERKSCSPIVFPEMTFVRKWNTAAWSLSLTLWHGSGSTRPGTNSAPESSTSGQLGRVNSACFFFFFFFFFSKVIVYLMPIVGFRHGRLKLYIIKIIVYVNIHIN